MSGEVLAGLAAAAAAALLVRATPTTAARRSSPRLVGVVRELGERLRARVTPTRIRQRRRGVVREAVAALAAELSAGHPPARALERSFAPVGVGPRAQAAVAWGGDVVESLRADARMPGCQLLVHVAACWSVAQGSGAGLAASLRGAVQADRDDEDIRTQLGAHLAAPRATARMLATLPVIGLVLGFATGGDPLAWLLGTPVGLGCLVGGAALIVLGLLWTSRIAGRVEALL